MKLIDTHTHLYLEDFKDDIDKVMKRAFNVGVEKFYIPSINSGHIKNMFDLEKKYPKQIRLMMGLHPNYVKENYIEELERQICEKEDRIQWEVDQWYYYYLPKFLSEKLWKGKFKGQKQKWFAFDFLGNDDEINIKQENIKPEFCNWKWVAPKNVCNIIINFKKDTYEKVLDEFSNIYS